jgi:hypothetical protein
MADVDQCIIKIHPKLWETVIQASAFLYSFEKLGTGRHTVICCLSCKRANKKNPIASSFKLQQTCEVQAII